MSQAWAICPVCGVLLAVEVVDAPERPAALLRHEREAHPPGVPSAKRPGEAEGGPTEKGDARPALPGHTPRRSTADRPHGRPARRAAKADRREDPTSGTGPGGRSTRAPGALATPRRGKPSDQ